METDYFNEVCPSCGDWSAIETSLRMCQTTSAVLGAEHHCYCCGAHWEHGQAHQMTQRRGKIYPSGTLVAHVGLSHNTK